MRINTEALLKANVLYLQVRDGVKFNKQKAAGELAAFGLLSIKEISDILALNFKQVEQAAGVRADFGPNNTGRVWNISALSALYLIAQDYDNGHVNKVLIQKVVKDGNSIRAVAELTGMPKDEIRKAVYDDPNLLDILRAGVDTASR